jgi:hypothetical protein
VVLQTERRYFSKIAAAIVSTEGEMLDWWMRSQGFQYVEYK